MVKTFSLTDVGMKRKINQDYLFTSEEPVGSLPNLFIVADGMGGHNAGDYASRRTTEIIVEEITKSRSSGPVRIIREAIETANEHIFSEAARTEAYYGMGTTCVVATIVDDQLYVANVGDSRLYIIDRDITQITKDHSLVEEMVRVGQIDRLSARTHPDKNIITRAVGTTEEVRIDFFDLKLEPGDRVLMCSDGLTNMVDDADIEKILSMDEELQTKCDMLVSLANQNGGLDNITVLIAQYDSEVTADE